MLSIKTVIPRPGVCVWYDGEREVHRQIFEGEESVDYAFIDTNPDSADNLWLWEAMEPLVKDDYDRKLPVEVLRSGDWVVLLAVLTFGRVSCSR